MVIWFDNWITAIAPVVCWPTTTREWRLLMRTNECFIWQIISIATRHFMKSIFWHILCDSIVYRAGILLILRMVGIFIRIAWPFLEKFEVGQFAWTVLSCSPQYCTCLVPIDKLSRKMPNRKQILKCSVELNNYWSGFRYLALRYLWLWGYWIFDISPHFCNFICNWPAKPIISNQGMF